MDLQTVTYQCPNCGAALEYDNEIGKFRCFYCDSTFEQSQMQQLFAENEAAITDENEPSLTEQQALDEEFTGQSALYTCPNCGAGVICDSLAASTRCHFCHTPVILSGRLSGDYRPDVIIPFSTTRELAEQSFRNYIKGKFLLPNGFGSEAQINNISALYVPYWLKSGLCDAKLSATGKKIRTWRTGDIVHTTTKIYNIERAAELAFIRVPCDGSKRIDDSLMESIEPFSYTGIKPFSMSYLSGCAAEKYDVPKEQAAVRIDKRVIEAAEQVLRQSVSGYTAVDNTSCTTNYRVQSYVYAMLPVWFLNYTYKGKDYAVAMNGQTGTMFGELPISKLKALLFGSGLFVVLGVILYFLVTFLGGVCIG